MKKDAQWKPLLRKFRKYFQSLIKTDSKNAKGYNYWPERIVVTKVTEFMGKIGLPRKYLDEE